MKKFIEFDKLGSMSKESYNKGFSVDVKKFHNEVCRSDWEDAPAPLRTFNLSDEFMQECANVVTKVISGYYAIDEMDEDAFNDAFWKEYESYMVDHNIPYYEDLTDKLPIGTKVYNRNSNHYGTITAYENDVAVLDNGEKEEVNYLIAEYHEEDNA